MELQQCGHQQQIGWNCRLCGAYLDAENGIWGLKTKRHGSPFVGNNQHVLRAIKKRSQKFVVTDGTACNNNLNEFVLSIVNRYNFCLQTHALGLYLFYAIVSKRINYSYNQLLYASVSLLIASKAIETEEKIPKMSSLKKAACNYIAKEEYTKAERAILQILDYNIDTCTFITFINYYLCCGIVFTHEKKMVLDLARLQNLVSNKATELVKSIRFMAFPQDKVAAYIVHLSRTQVGLPGWNKQLEKISGISEEGMKQLTKDLEALKKPHIIPMQFHSVNIIKAKQLICQMQKKDSIVSTNCFREVSRESLVRDSRRNFLTVITTGNDPHARDNHSLIVRRR